MWWLFTFSFPRDFKMLSIHWGQCNLTLWWWSSNYQGHDNENKWATATQLKRSHNDHLSQGDLGNDPSVLTRSLTIMLTRCSLTLGSMFMSSVYGRLVNCSCLSSRLNTDWERLRERPPPSWCSVNFFFLMSVVGAPCPGLEGMSVRTPGHLIMSPSKHFQSLQLL